MSILLHIVLQLVVVLFCAAILKCMTAKVGGGFLLFWQACVIMLISAGVSYIPYLGLVASFVVSCILVYKWGSADSVGGCILTVLISNALSVLSVYVIGAIIASLTVIAD